MGCTRKQDKQNMNAGRSWAKGWKFWLSPTSPNRKPFAFMADKCTGKDKVNPYHFPSYLSLVFPDPAAHMFLYLCSHCKTEELRQLSSSQFALAPACSCSSQGKVPIVFWWVELPDKTWTLDHNKDRGLSAGKWLYSGHCISVDLILSPYLSAPAFNVTETFTLKWS